MSTKRIRHQQTGSDVAFFSDLKKRCEERSAVEEEKATKLCPPLVYPENSAELLSAVSVYALESFSNLHPDDAHIGIHEESVLRLWKKNTLITPLKSSEWWTNVFAPWFKNAYAARDASPDSHEWVYLNGHISEMLDAFEKWFCEEWEKCYGQVKMTMENGKVRIKI